MADTPRRTRRYVVDQFNRQQTCEDCRQVKVLRGVTGWCKACFDKHMMHVRHSKRMRRP